MNFYDYENIELPQDDYDYIEDVHHIPADDEFDSLEEEN